MIQTLLVLSPEDKSINNTTILEFCKKYQIGRVNEKFTNVL